MDITERKITKIAREVEKFTVRSLKSDGVGTAELDFIHAVRHNPGITQAGVRMLLNIDKGAAARRTASLESKGYLIQTPDESDKRCRHLYATEKADELKNSKASVEAIFYEWLTETLTKEEAERFSAILDRLYSRSKNESRAGFINVGARIAGGNNEKDENR